MPAISVIMPVYNIKETYLRQAAESIINQTFKDFEAFFVNDGSTDKHVLPILEEYQKKDKRITVINQDNRGLSAARNSALEKCSGEFIAFLDSDDFYEPHFLELMLKAQEETNADIVGCEFQKIKKSNETVKSVAATKPRVYENALGVLLDKGNFIHFNVWNKLYHRKLFDNIRFVEGIYFEDWVFNSIVFSIADKFAWIKEPLYGYRISANSIMRSSFNKKKLDYYVTGISEVYGFYQKNAPALWDKVQRRRISRTVKMMMRATLKTKDKGLLLYAKNVIKELYQKGIISYKGLKVHHKLRLFWFLHY